VAKIMATGQGGFTVTNSDDLAERMRAIRTHGVENVKDPGRWVMPGFNFRFTDVLASIGLEQLKRLPERLNHLRTIYKIYEEGLVDSPFRMIPVDLDAGEVPVYNEFLVHNRQEWIDRLERCGIETRPFYPDVDTAHYFGQNKDFPNSRPFGRDGIYLPSGPSQKLSDISRVVKWIKKKN